MFAAAVTLGQQQSRSTQPQRQSSCHLSDSSTSACATANGGLSSRQQFAEALHQHFGAFAAGGMVSPETAIGKLVKSNNYGGTRMRGVTRHKRTQRYEGHIWESKKQVYLGAYDSEALAGMAHDIMALHCKGLAGAKVLNFPPECYTPLLPLIGRLSREEVVAALRHCSRIQQRSGAADGGARQQAATSLSPQRSQPGSLATVAPTVATSASRVRKAESPAAPALTINVRRRLYSASDLEGGSPMPASPKRLNGKMPPPALWPPCSLAAVAAAAASCAFPALSAAGVGCGSLHSTAAGVSAGTLAEAHSGFGSGSPLLSLHCQQATAPPCARRIDAPTAALNGGAMATAAIDAARHGQLFQLQRHTQQHQQQAAVDQEMAGSELFAGAAADDLLPSSSRKRPAASFLDVMEAGMELERPITEVNSLIFSAIDDAYLFQPSMLTPKSSLPTSCIGMEHANGTMLLTDWDHPAGAPGPPATPTAVAAQEAAAKAQAQAPDATLGEIDDGVGIAAEQLPLRSPPTSPSLRLRRVPPLAAGVPVAPPPPPRIHSGSVMAASPGPSPAQPAIWSTANLWRQPSAAATRPGYFQPGRLLPSNACATATAAPLGSNRISASPAPALECPFDPGQLVRVLPAAAVPSLPDAAVPATLPLPVRYPNPFLNPNGYPYSYVHLQPPSSIDAVRAASMAALQHAGLLSPLQWGLGLPSHPPPGAASAACSPFAMYSGIPFPS